MTMDSDEAQSSDTCDCGDCRASGAMLGRAQSVFSVSSDEPHAMVVPPSGIVSDYLLLKPRSTPPFTCDASVVGAVYIQTDETVGAIYSYRQVLCHCQPIDDLSGYFWKFEGPTTSGCDLLLP